jgi:hypothetical protein
MVAEGNTQHLTDLVDRLTIAAAAAVVALDVRVVSVSARSSGPSRRRPSPAIDVLLKRSTGEGSWAMLGPDTALTPGAR